MKKTSKTTPPFAWLGRFRTPVAGFAVTITAAFFRFYQLGSLPPGLDQTSAQIGVQALNVGNGHWLPSLSATNGYAPLWIWLQALAVHVFGSTELALRLWPALLGTLAVLATWLWVRDWLGQRVGAVAALLLAVSPWVVTDSRNGIVSSLIPLVAATTFWLAGRAWKQLSTLRFTTLGIAMAISLLCGPLGWLIATLTIALGIWQLVAMHKLTAQGKQKVPGIVIFALGGAILAYFIGVSLSALKNLPHDLGLVTTGGQFFQNLAKVLVMFNIHGDENYHHNLSGEPLLNAFVGLMFVAGLLVAISRSHERRYRLLLIITVVLTVPAALATLGVPNSSYAIAAVPSVFALAGVGTSYMLELWYATFPINSAARATGQAAIILLLALSLLQGYTQYFRAWAGSTAVYLAYNEGSAQIGHHLKTDRFDGERYVVVPADQVAVVEYLAHGAKAYKTLQIDTLTNLPLSTTPRQYYIATASRDEAIKVLKAKFPGGVLRPHYSSFNQAEIYYTYEATK